MPRESVCLSWIAGPLSDVGVSTLHASELACVLTTYVQDAQWQDRYGNTRHRGDIERGDRSPDRSRSRGVAPATLPDRVPLHAYRERGTHHRVGNLHISWQVGQHYNDRYDRASDSASSACSPTVLSVLQMPMPQVLIFSHPPLDPRLGRIACHAVQWDGHIGEEPLRCLSLPVRWQGIR